MSLDRDRIVEICDAYCASMSVGDPDATTKLFAPDATQEEPVGTPARHGHDEIRGFFAQHQDMGFKLTRLGPVTVVGNRAALQIQVEVPTEGGSRFLTATDLITVDDDGLISAIVVYPDMHADPRAH